MALTYKKIGIIAKHHLENKEQILAPLLDLLKKQGAEVYFDEKTLGDIPSAKTFSKITSARTLDLIIAVGGDGTILRTVRELRPGSVPILAVNAGSVGFLSEISLADVEKDLPPFLSGTAFPEKRSSIDIAVLRKGKEVFSSIGLNDAVISQGSISRLLDLKAEIGKQFLATYHADGLIIATPTGSTAYSLASGGPVVHPTLSALILTPINPHSFTQKPIVIPGDSLVDISILRKDAPDFDITVGLTVDGQVYHTLEEGDTVSVRTSEVPVVFLRKNEDTFYKTLRTKLKWGEVLEGRVE